MRKKVLGLALMAMALVGFNGMSQTVAQNSKAQVENKSCCKQGDKKGGKQGMKKEAREMKNPYEGLTLTEAQKTKLSELDAKQMAKRQAKMEARKANAQKKNMTDAEKQAAKQQKMEARKAEKMEYLQEVKAIVGPDQYVVFLENIYVNAGQPGGGKAIKQGDRGGKQGFAHSKGTKDSRKGDRKSGRKSLKS